MTRAALVLVSALLATTAHAADLAACKDEACLRKLVPRHGPTSVKPDDCAVLDGKVAHKDDDLGVVCRLFVARNAASTRAQAPCHNDDDNPSPDWSSDLDQRPARGLQHGFLFAPLLAQHALTGADSGSTNASEMNGSFIFDRKFQSGGHAVSAAAWFCIADSPTRYVPYFYALEVDGKPVAMGAPPEPVGDPVFGQLDSGDVSCDAPALVDLDGEGHRDLVCAGNGDKGVVVSACLYAATGDACTTVTATDHMPAAHDAVPTVTMSKRDVLVTVNGPKGKPVHATYRLVGRQLKKL